jgi:hypothetical protein
MGLDCTTDLLAMKSTSSVNLHKSQLVPKQVISLNFKTTTLAHVEDNLLPPIANQLTDTFSTLPLLRSITQITYGNVFTMADAMGTDNSLHANSFCKNVDGRRQLTCHIASDGLTMV